LILITTTRRPSRRTRSFVRDLYHVLPDAIRRNRGKMSLEDLNELALQLGADRVLVVGTSRGNPSSLAFYEPHPSAIRPISVIHLRGVSLRREITDKRAPQSRDLCITYSSPALAHPAQVFSLSFNVKEPILASLRQLTQIEEYDLTLHLSPGPGGTINSSFFRIRPPWEVGPRMRIGGFREYEGESRLESESNLRE